MVTGGGSVPLPTHTTLPPLVYGLLWLPVLLGLAVTPADDGVLPTHLTLLLRPAGDGDDVLFPVIVSVSVLLLPMQSMVSLSLKIPC